MMGPSSSMVEHREFLYVFLQPFSFDQKTECHVQESSGKHGYRRFGSGETETDESGVKEPLESKENPSSPPRSRKIRVVRTARGMKSWIRVLFHGAPGNWSETTTKTQPHILKSGEKMTLDLRAPGNWGGVVNLQAQPSPGNWSDVRTSKLEGQRWNSTTCRSPTMDTLRTSSRTCNNS